MRSATPFPRFSRVPPATPQGKRGVVGSEEPGGRLRANLRPPKEGPPSPGPIPCRPFSSGPPSVDPSDPPPACSSRQRPTRFPWCCSAGGAGRRGHPSSVHPKSGAARTWLPGVQEGRERGVPSYRCRCLPEDPVAACVQRRGSTCSICVYRRCLALSRFPRSGEVRRCSSSSSSSRAKSSAFPAREERGERRGRRSLPALFFPLPTHSKYPNSSKLRSPRRYSSLHASPPAEERFTAK